jgi:CDGSH-type Zn-finger protein
MNKLVRISATAASSLALVAGFSGVVGATGSNNNCDCDGSHNRITRRNTVRTTVRNTNDIDVSNRTYQSAESGDVKVFHNDDVGDVTSGDASNDNYTEANVNVENTTDTGRGGSGSFSSSSLGGFGFDGSHNRVDISNRQTTNVTNRNDIEVSNTTTQRAESGDVTVAGNDDVGDVTSGDATNTNTSFFDVNVTNDTSTR